MIKIFRKSKEGFTLLEVLVTMVIAAVLLSTILFSFISARQIAIRNRNRIIGMAHCASLLEFLRNYVSGDYAAAKYIEPWAGGTAYALSVGTHTAPLSYEAADSFLYKMATPWVRQYTVTDQAVTGVPATATLKKVSMTVRPGP